MTGSAVSNKMRLVIMKYLGNPKTQLFSDITMRLTIRSASLDALLVRGGGLKRTLTTLMKFDKQNMRFSTLEALVEAMPLLSEKRFPGIKGKNEAPAQKRSIARGPKKSIIRNNLNL